MVAPGHWIDGVNTLRPRQNGRHFADDTFKRIFLNENVGISIKISLKFVHKGPINNIPALVQIMAWRRPGDKPLSESMMVSLLTHICVARPQWVNSLWSINATWLHGIWPALIQVVACCLTAPCHYLTHHQWPLVSFWWGRFHIKFWQSLQCVWKSFIQNLCDISQDMAWGS